MAILLLYALLRRQCNRILPRINSIEYESKKNSINQSLDTLLDDIEEEIRVLEFYCLIYNQFFNDQISGVIGRLVQIHILYD